MIGTKSNSFFGKKSKNFFLVFQTRLLPFKNTSPLSPYPSQETTMGGRSNGGPLPIKYARHHSISIRIDTSDTSETHQPYWWESFNPIMRMCVHYLYMLLASRKWQMQNPVDSWRSETFSPPMWAVVKALQSRWIVGLPVRLPPRKGAWRFIAVLCLG